MSLVKHDFLNWRPDQEFHRHDGLIVADNLLHSVKGYEQYKTPTAGAFATSTALGTCPSVIVKSVGTNDQRIVAWLHGGAVSGAGASINMSIGIFSEGFTTIGTYTTFTSSTITSQFTGNVLTAFQVCELDDKIFFTAQAELPVTTALNASAPVITLNATGYATI